MCAYRILPLREKSNWMATKAKTPKARITMERVHVLGSNQKEFDFVRTPTVCQAQ